MKLFKRLKLFASCLFIISISSWANLHLGLYLGYCFTWANCYALEKEKATWRLIARQHERATAPIHLWPTLRFRPINSMCHPCRNLLCTLRPRPNNPRALTRCTFYKWSLSIKNILSFSYELRFEYQLHRCILHDETNKTRSHLHIFWRCLQ